MDPLRKIFYLYITLKLVMSTYSAGWCFMELGSIASGLAYNGIDANGNHKFDGVQCIGIIKLETSLDVKEFLANWNMSYQKWLKYYVYLRILPNDRGGSVNFAAFITFIVSAIWHGFYPGFMHFFFMLFLCQYHSWLCKEVLAPRVAWIPNLLQNLFIYIFCYLYCAYYALSFVLLHASEFHKVYLEMGYLGHILMLTSIVSLSLVKVIFPLKTPKSKRAPLATAEKLKLN